MSRLLISEPPLMVLPSLAVKIGLNEAIFVQQLHYLLQMSQNHRDDKAWVYNTFEEWGEIFPFLSVKTIKRVVLSLKKLGIISSTCKYNRMKMDKTQWYSINYEELDKLTLREGQNDPIDGTKCPDGEGQNDPMSSGQNDPSNNHKNKTTTKTTNKRLGEANLIEHLISVGADENTANDFVGYREKIKKPLTITAINRLAGEAQRANRNINDAMAVAMDRGWVSFQSHYDVDGSKGQINQGAPNGRSLSKQEQIEAHNQRLVDQMFGGNNAQ